MSKNANVSITASGQDERPTHVIIEDPVTGTKILLVDPEFNRVKHQQVSIITKSAESFADAVLASPGSNKLVELRENGEFVYRDALGDKTINTVRFKLLPAPACKVLGLQGGFQFTQRELLQWKDQWPGTLLPDSDNPEADFEDLAHYKAQGVKNVDILTTDTSIRVNVERDDHADGTKVPRFWKGRSPLFDQHTQQEVTLKLEVVTPEAHPQTGAVSGVLTFCFDLWTPAASAVTALAMDDAATAMSALLEGYTLIRGAID